MTSSSPRLLLAHRNPSLNIEVFAFADVGGSSAPLLVANAYDNGGGWPGWGGISYYSSAWNNIPATKISAAAFGASSVYAYPFFNTPVSWGGNPGVDQRTFLLSYIDINNRLWIGVLDETNCSGSTCAGLTLGTPAWQVYNLPFQPVDLDVAIPSPGRYDIVIRDIAGDYWDCFSNDGGQSAPTCNNYGPPASGTVFVDAPGAVGLGDGRLLIAGHGSDGTGYSAFFSQGFWTTWLHTGGGFNGGI